MLDKKYEEEKMKEWENDERSKEGNKKEEIRKETVTPAHETRDVKELVTKHIKCPKCGGKVSRRSRSDEKKPMVIYSEDEVCHVLHVESRCAAETHCKLVF